MKDRKKLREDEAKDRVAAGMSRANESSYADDHFLRPYESRPTDTYSLGAGLDWGRNLISNRPKKVVYC